MSDGDRQTQLADLWERLVDAGLSEAEATQHVQRLDRVTSPEAFARDRKTTGWEKAASAALGASQAVTLGLGDEAAALIEATARKLVPGGKGFKETYREAREAERATRTAAPGYALAGDIAGSVLMPGAGAAGLIRAVPVTASKLARAGRAAAVLGGTGAIEGAARGETPAGRVAGAALGGTTGVALGASPVALAIAKEYMLLPFSRGGRVLRAMRRARPALKGTEGRLIGKEEVLARRAERAMDQPTYLRRGQPTPPERVRTTPEGAQVIPETAALEQAALEESLLRPVRQRHRPFLPETREAGMAQLKARMAAARGEKVSGEAMRATTVPATAMPESLDAFTEGQLKALLHAADVDPAVSLSPTQYAAVKDELARRAAGGGAAGAVPFEAAAGSVEVGGRALPLNPDGTVTLYHGTTKTGARAILQEGRLRGKEDGVFLSTDPSAVAASYGDGTVVAVNVDPKSLRIDDEFPGGRVDYRIPLQRPGASMRIGGARLESVPHRPTGLLAPGTRVIEALQAPITDDARKAVVNELRKASPTTKGSIVAWLQAHAPDPTWAEVLAESGLARP